MQDRCPRPDPSQPDPSQIGPAADKVLSAECSGKLGSKCGFGGVSTFGPMAGQCQNRGIFSKDLRQCGGVLAAECDGKRGGKRIGSYSTATRCNVVARSP